MLIKIAKLNYFQNILVNIRQNSTIYLSKFTIFKILKMNKMKIRK